MNSYEKAKSIRWLLEALINGHITTAYAKERLALLDQNVLNPALLIPKEEADE